MNFEISFIIPVFNKETWQLKHCIDSILQFQNDNYEIIIIDDGSTSKKSKEYRELISNNKKIKYFYETNGGVSKARNFGLQKAQGKYIFFIDADDEIIVKDWDNINLKNETSELIIFNVERVDLSTHKLATFRLNNTLVSKNGLLIQMLKDGLLNWVYAKLYLRKWLIKNNITFDESKKIGEDLDFIYKIIENNPRVKYFDKVAYRYLFSSKPGIDRIINFPKENIKDIYSIYKLRMNIIEENNQIDAEKYIISLQEKAIDGFFAIFKSVLEANKTSNIDLYKVINSYITLLGNVHKVNIKSEIKMKIMKNKMFMKIYVTIKSL